MKPIPSAEVAHRLVLACFVVAGLSAQPAVAEDSTIIIEVDRGEDVGRNFGSLFERKGPDGAPLLGAGFLGAYNTYDRADRHTLQVFEANRAPAQFRVLPRVNADSGVYLFDRDGRLFARSAADGLDARVCEFDPQTETWSVAEGVAPESCTVAGGLLEVAGREVRYRGRPILAWPEDRGRLGRLYYGQGRIFAWNHFDAEDPRTERYLAWEWTPRRAEALDPDAALTLPLEKKREFPYAVGQWRDDVVLTTNLGGIYRLRDGRWDQLRKHDGKSYQVYASLDVGGSLWLAQYPSGEVWRYDGVAIEPVADHPPVPPGVSRSAREAQSLTLFGGEVYAGVWPWGELWRFRPGPDDWTLIRRMFARPETTAATVHPYEAETAARDAVANLWGQRVTSLVPLGDSLYIATSAKGSRPWDPSIDFLDEAAREEYGRVHRMTRPGHLAAPLRWTEGPTTIVIRLTDDAIDVLQDGRPIGRARRAPAADRPAPEAIGQARFLQGDGLYGPARVRSLKVREEGAFMPKRESE